MNQKTSSLQYFVFSFLSLLLLRYASSAYSSTPPRYVLENCTSIDQPNPIASLYPNNATGTLNGTIAVLPIPLELARQLIPSQYGILEGAYRALLPSFPEGMYPAIVQSVHDHDVQAFGYKIDDFSRAGIEFPFLDLLGDGYSSFKWAPSLLMTAGNDVALKGAQDYGTNTFPASFDPGCDAYRAVPNANAGTTYFAAESQAGPEFLNSLFSTTDEEIYPLSFFKNTTNQPTFADGKTCDNMIRLFNTSVTSAGKGIERVKGTVRANIHPFSEEREWSNVYGIRLDSAFIENNYLSCESFQGYTSHE